MLTDGCIAETPDSTADVGSDTRRQFPSKLLDIYKLACALLGYSKGAAHRGQTWGRPEQALGRGSLTPRRAGR